MPKPGPSNVECKHCGAHIGVMIDIYDQRWLLLANSIVVRNVFGACWNCQKPFHWSASDEMLAMLVEQTLKLRKNTL